MEDLKWLNESACLSPLLLCLTVVEFKLFLEVYDTMLALLKGDGVLWSSARDMSSWVIKMCKRLLLLLFIHAYLIWLF